MPIPGPDVLARLPQWPKCDSGIKASCTALGSCGPSSAFAKPTCYSPNFKPLVVTNGLRHFIEVQHLLDPTFLHVMTKKGTGSALLE